MTLSHTAISARHDVLTFRRLLGMRLLSILQGSGTEFFSENPVKMGEVLKATVKTNFGDRK